MNPNQFNMMFCDGCGHRDTFEDFMAGYDTLKMSNKEVEAILPEEMAKLKQHFIDNGWRNVRGEDFCPKCVSEIKVIS